MKIYISYFYQIRFFTPNMIPMSTAVSDPKWYHNHQGNKHIYFDKRGVINGVRAETLHPDNSCADLCGGKDCSQDPSECKFLRLYRKQLNKIDFDKFLKQLKKLSHDYQACMKLDNPVDIVLIVHEAPTNKCSERVVLQEWFESNGYHLKEWSKS